jgi:translation elongation factor EF-4
MKAIGSVNIPQEAFIQVLNKLVRSCRYRLR